MKGYLTTDKVGIFNDLAPARCSSSKSGAQIMLINPSIVNIVVANSDSIVSTNSLPKIVSKVP